MNYKKKTLRAFSVACYSVGGISAVFGCLALTIFIWGVLLFFAPHQFGHSDMDIPIGFFLVLCAGPLLVLSWIIAFCTFMIGRELARKATSPHPDEDQLVANEASGHPSR